MRTPLLKVQMPVFRYVLLNLLSIALYDYQLHFWGLSFTKTIILNQGHSSYEGVSKSFRTGRLERELQMVQLSATRCSCIVILWVSLVSFAAIILCVASQRVFIIVYSVIDYVRKLLVIPPYFHRRTNSYKYTRATELSVVLLNPICASLSLLPKDPKHILPQSLNSG
jgi:hypothetical protein